MNPRLKKFFSYYKPYRLLFLADILCAFVVSIIALMLPLGWSYLSKHLSQGAAINLNQIYLIGAIMLILVLIHTLCHIFIDYQGHMMGAKMESDMRLELFAHYQKLPFSFYDEQKTGQLISRLTNDTFALSELYHHGPEDLAIALIKFIGTFFILININLKLSLIVFAFLPIMAIYAFYFNYKMRLALQKSQESIGAINEQIEDSLAGIRVVTSFANEAIEMKKFALANDNFVNNRKLGYRSEAYFYGGILGFTQLINLAVIIFGSIAIVKANLQVADLITFLLCVSILIEPITRMVNFARLYQEAIAGFNRFMEILETSPAINEAPNTNITPQLSGAIEFRNVSFKYKEDYEHILKNLSLNIQTGEYIALVGISGAGKTTLCSLIPRFYEVSTGEILLDNINIKNIPLEMLRKNIGVVAQDIYLFAGTIAENIQYGRIAATMEEVIAAAKQAHAHEFIMNLPNAYATDIGQRGIKLSGGQKQRLAIARVFLKNPPIVIFDEATSALDNESEAAIRDSLTLLSKQRTIIVIAHRLSSIKNAQRIIVLNDDGIAEQGTHDELITLNKIYAKLYAML